MVDSHSRSQHLAAHQPMLLAGWFDEGPLSMMCICGASFPTPMALYRNCQRDQPPARLLSLCTHAAQHQSSQQPPPPANRRRAVDCERVSCAPPKAASRELSRAWRGSAHTAESEPQVRARASSASAPARAQDVKRLKSTSTASPRPVSH